MSIASRHTPDGRLQRWRRLARLMLWSERLTASLWPAVTAAMVLAGIALTGLLPALPPALHLLLFLGALAGLSFLVLRGRALPAPKDKDAERRLERDSGLRHRPLAVLSDRPAGNDAAGSALWALHQARARQALGALRLAPPDPVLAAADPYAIRAAAFLFLVAGLVMAGPEAANRLASAVFPVFHGSAEAAAPVVQAWIMPPAYTGLPPLFLPSGSAGQNAPDGSAGQNAPDGSAGQNALDGSAGQNAPYGSAGHYAAAGAGGQHPIEVPAGSKLTISVTGADTAPGVSLAGASHGMERLGGDNFEAAFVVTQSGRLHVGSLVSDLAAWDITVLPNEKPVAQWTGLPGRAGSTTSTRFPWAVSQRWGVAALQVELVPKDHPGLPPLALKLPLPGTPKQAKSAATLDLESQPLAGAMVTARLRARDVSGQSGSSDAVEFVLPARTFRNPLAKAIIELRRRLALHPERPADAAADLAALASMDMPNLPHGLAQDGVVLNMVAAAALLEAPHAGADAINEAQARLWTLALALDGALGDASARALAEAQERLKEGIEDHALGKLSDKELQKRVEALRQALEKRMQDIAREAMQRGAIEKFDPRSQHLSSAAMDRAMRQMEQAMREGRTEDAKRALSELQKMFDQLKTAHILSKQEMQQREQAEKRGQQMMGAVQDMVRRESTLLDHAQARAPQLQQGVQPFRGFDLLRPPGALDAMPPSPHSTDQAPDDLPGLPPAEAGPPDGGQQAEKPGDRPGAQPGDQGGGQQDAQQNGPHPGQPAAPKSADPPARQQAQDARTQRALHRALDALSQGFQESGGKSPPALDEAGTAMKDASSALSRGDDPVARDAIGRAIAALQQGGQDMSRQMSSQSGGEMQLSLQGGASKESGSGAEGDDNLQEGRGGQKKDPFGRQVDGSGTVADDPSLRVPEQGEEGRSRAIQEELRRRGADRQRSQEELDYINRLLKPF